jgi:GntR family transcriptional regulator
MRRLQHDFQVGDKIPTEHALAASFGVSRETVRGAIRELEADGLLTRRAGAGTFVARRPSEPAESRVTGLVEDYTELRFDTETRVLAQAAMAPTRNTAEALKLGAGQMAYWISRLRYLDGGPLATHDSFTTVPLGRRIGRSDLRHTTVTREAQRIVGQKLEEEWHEIEADVADSDKAAALEIPVGAPLLIITRLYTAADEPVVLFRTYFRADRYYYTSKLRQNPKPSRPSRRRQEVAG